MLKKKFTTVTQLHTSLNKDLIDYVDKTLPFYSKAVRERVRRKITIKPDSEKKKDSIKPKETFPLF